MIINIIIYAIININFFKKIIYPINNFTFIQNDEPIIWNLKEKNITDIFTLTLLFKYSSNIDQNNGFLSFGYYKLFFHNINFYKDLMNNSSLKLGDIKDSRNFNLIANHYYFILIQVEKNKLVTNIDFQYKTILKFGNKINKSFDISNISYSNVDLDNFIINLGSNYPEENSTFNFTIENITFYNNSLNNNEINSIILGGSESLVFIDFANAITFSQYYLNKLNTNYIGGINGMNIKNDEYDLFTEYTKISDTSINKKLLIFKSLQYIKLSPILSKLYSLEIYNNWVYLKLSVHLNSINAINNINSDFYIYNINNKSGINLKLIRLINSASEKFEVELKFIENNTLSKSIISSNNTLNFDFLILIYEKQENSDYKIKLSYRVNNSYDSLEFTNNNPPNFTDKHYIGSITAINSLNINYILIELEEFMIGKGSYINNLDNGENIIYDNIVLFCNTLTNNKILRNENLNSCNLRSNNISLEISNCEYAENSICIFKLPDDYDLINGTQLNVIKPYRQTFNSIPNFNINSNNNSDPSNYRYTYNYSSNFIINNNLIIEMTFVNNNSSKNIKNNIFRVIFNSVTYSYIYINNDKNSITYSLEIPNNNSLTNPSIIIENLSNNNFIISFISLMEINYSIINVRNEKFIGEKISLSYILWRNKPYASNVLNNSQLRNVDNLYIFCHNSCLNGCTGPSSNNCSNCKNNFINYKGCIKKKAWNCSSYWNNPTYCNQCNINFLPIHIDSSRVLCLCHSSCKTCNGSSNNNCTSCYSNYILYNDNTCKHIIAISNCNKNFIFKPKDTSISGDIDKCLKCGEGCNECTLSNLSHCLNCLYGYHLFNNICIRCSEDRKFINYNIKDNNNQSICQSCHNSCKTCNNNLISGCLSCETNKYLLINNNSKTCDNCNNTGYYKEDNLCKICNNNCLSCRNNSKFCTRCKSNYLLDNLKNDCIISCRIGTYQSGNNCYKCHNNCKTCSTGGELSCIECSNNLFYNVIDNKCETCMNIGYVKIKDKCYKCHTNCLSCNGINKNNCLLCKNNLNLNEITYECLNICPINTYSYIINNKKLCRKCNYGCLKCLNFKENSCTKCEINFLFNKYTNRCLKICEVGYFKLNEFECEKCNENCLKCKSLKTCLICIKGFYFLEDECSVWKKGYYISNIKLLKCSPNCNTCNDYDNCLTCESNKIRIFNTLINKFYCKLNCKNDKFFSKIKNKCITCIECDKCQINNEIVCKKCNKCENECKFNFKFNETGLYLFNNKNINFKLNMTNFQIDNLDWVLDHNKILNYNYFFNITNNNDDLNKINLKFNNNSLLFTKNCIKSTNINIIIKKTYDKSCNIKVINYNNSNNMLYIKSNFLINKISIQNLFSYKIFKPNQNFKNYILKENDINFITDYNLKMKFIPNYYKNSFKVEIKFNKKIIKKFRCTYNKPLIGQFNFKNLNNKIIYEDDNKINLKYISPVLSSNNTLGNSFKKSKEVIENVRRGTIGITILSSIFSQFLGILIRFFQVVYILDYIYLLKINLGEYTNTFLKYLEFDVKLYVEINSKLNISYVKMEHLITKVITSNPKLKKFEFIYLTNLNLEFIFLLILISFEIIFFIVIYFFKKFEKNKKNKNNILLNEIKIKNKKNDKKDKKSNIAITITSNKNLVKKRKKKIKKNNNYTQIPPKMKINVNKKNIFLIFFKNLFIKIKSLKITYIGFIFPNLLTSVSIYSEIFYNFNIKNRDDIKLITIFILYYLWIIIYLREIFISIEHQQRYKKQRIKYYYRNNLFIFSNKYEGIHNYIMIFGIVRDILIIVVGITVNIPVLIQSILFIIIQVIFITFIFLIKSKYDYKNIQLFRLQELINLSLLIIVLILYFYKGVIIQFLFIILYFFLILISLLNLIYDFLYSFVNIINYLLSKKIK